MEPILYEDENNFANLLNENNKYAAATEMLKMHRKVFWIDDEINVEKDRETFMKLAPNVRKYISRVLTFFAHSDKLVNDNNLQNFLTNIKVFQLQEFYGWQFIMENIHTRTYLKVLNACLTEKEIKEAQETIKNQLTRETDEKGIALLQGQFAALDWVIVEEVKTSTGGEQQ